MTYTPKPGAKYTKRNYAIPEPKVERRCLRCDQKFTAKGRFVRLCRACHNTINVYYSSGVDYMGVWAGGYFDEVTR